MILFLKILAFAVLIGQIIVSVVSAFLFSNLFEAFISFALLYSLALILQHLKTMESYLLTLGDHIIERDKKQEGAATGIEKAPQPISARVGMPAPPLAPSPVSAQAPSAQPSAPNKYQRHDGESVTPEPQREGYVRCPLCNTVQKANRPVCFNCNATFKNS